MANQKIVSYRRKKHHSSAELLSPTKLGIQVTRHQLPPILLRYNRPFLETQLPCPIASPCVRGADAWAPLTGDKRRGAQCHHGNPAKDVRFHITMLEICYKTSIIPWSMYKSCQKNVQSHHSQQMQQPWFSRNFPPFHLVKL